MDAFWDKEKAAFRAGADDARRGVLMAEGIRRFAKSKELREGTQERFERLR